MKGSPVTSWTKKDLRGTIKVIKGGGLVEYSERRPVSRPFLDQDRSPSRRTIETMIYAVIS